MAIRNDLPPIPDDDGLAEMSHNELRSLAGAFDLPAGRSVSSDRMRHNLARIREDGGRILRCPRESCGHVWVYQGDQRHKAACPECTTSVMLEANTIRVFAPVDADDEGGG